MKTQNCLDNIFARAKGSGKTIVLPEGYDERAVNAAIIAAKADICNIVLLGDKNAILPKIPKSLLTKIKVIDPAQEKTECARFAQRLYELRKHKGMTIAVAEEQVKNPMMFATMMLSMCEADGVVAGIVLPTAEVLRPAFQVIKTREGVSKVSSAMILEMPKGSALGENGVLVLADCGVIPDPTSEDLVDIAIESSKTAKTLCGIDARVAMLSYSTLSKTDTGNPSVEKVKAAAAMLNLKHPEMTVEGEIQVDAALVSEVAKVKCPKSKLQGRANVLVFPDLNSANISYKLAQRVAGVRAVGPLLQGLNKPINDMSRGATAAEMAQTIAITVLQSMNNCFLCLAF